jgi:G patch domain/KOW motif-containing protein
VLCEYVGAICLFAEAQGNTGEDGDKPQMPLIIAQLLANRVPDNMESESRLDVALRPDMAADSDYAAVPIDQFGMGMLRGMGWSEGEPIGRTNKKYVHTLEASV